MTKASRRRRAPVEVLDRKRSSTSIRVGENPICVFGTPNYITCILCLWDFNGCSMGTTLSTAEEDHGD